MELISRQAAIDVVAKAYRYESDRMAELQELPIYDLDEVIEQLKAEGCVIDDEAGHRAVEIIKSGGLN